MSEYKDTLNLPKTDFPMKASLSQREPEILAHWEKMDLYHALREQGASRPKFVLHDGPPYANGQIHVGHAAQKSLKDMIVKSKIFSGFDAPFVPGWDCHGLPIELNVEKKKGKPGHKISVAEFRKACREYALSQIDLQRQDFKRLGIVGDWDHPYITMDYHYEANIIRSLAKIVANGHLHRGQKPVHWCLDCASALAEAEVEYADKVSPAIDVAFTVAHPKDLINRLHLHEDLSHASISIPIWTTTPWTLPANQAVSLHPTLTYVLVHHHANQAYYIIGKALLASVMARYGATEVSDYTVIAECEGGVLEGLQLQHPFYDRYAPVVLGEHVTMETGTGAVHTAPVHGEDDYHMGVKYGLSMENPIMDNGCFLKDLPFVGGLHVNQANDPIMALLNERKVLIHSTKLSHSYPHCWRHKTPIIFRATPQWFISMDQNGLRKEAMQQINEVSWVPTWGKARIETMIANRPDWCISRQRTWGVPLSLFIHRETGELHPDTVTLMHAVADRVEEHGIDVWFDASLKIALLGAESENYQAIPDILDVWFDSGVTHECVLKQNEALHFPADLILEGSDQHRGWFQSALLTSVAMNRVAPYRTVLTHGFVVDGQGRKMSKSLGNVIVPDEVIKTLGADILRLWAASIDYRNEMALSNEILTRISEMYRRIRNTIRFFLANLNGFDPATDLLPLDDMLSLDRFAVSQMHALQTAVIDAYEQYQFHAVVHQLHQFCVTEMGSFYLDIIKDRQYTMQQDSRGRRSCQTALYHITQSFLRLMAPILSFTAEEAWRYLPGEKAQSIFLSTWYDQLSALSEHDQMNADYWNRIKTVREVVNKEIEVKRNGGVIGSALEAEVTLSCQGELKQQLDQLGNELRFVFITSEVIVTESPLSNGIQTSIPGLTLNVTSTTYAKCERCWHRRAEVNQASRGEHATLCHRCVENVIGKGEVRQYA